ncbi:proteasome regulatory particle base subunit rpn10 [Tieghemiomyces parasiticus]|uniref:Proteasome regulatory particle base subunit rpn10 n=1 Tax=Tieghemiomyces parasiticus TaxID=78921 RepID=A0A9W8AAX7_9FUNG|nr:proteasome regulatory particle base subunit rpn10 [Tieghemiomyces parasiticus]
MRNGDYTPSRFAAQKDAVNTVYEAKLNDNPENTVAFLTMAGKSPEMLVTLTSDMGQILSGLHKLKLGGKPNLEAAIQIAQLALKHRANMNQRQRIVAFVASPVETAERTLVQIAKKLKKNNVALDFISFGEVDANEAKLTAFTNAINNNDNSHLVALPPAPQILSERVRNSPILASEDGGSGGYGDAETNDYEFGVDPNLDPELALALRMSMEEERARQAATAPKTEGTPSDSKVEVGGSDSAANAGSSSGKAPTVATDLTEDELMAQALAMSTDGDVTMGDADEDDEIARAIALSMQEASEREGADEKKKDQS